MSKIFNNHDNGTSQRRHSEMVVCFHGNVTVPIPFACRSDESECAHVAVILPLCLQMRNRSAAQLSNFDPASPVKTRFKFSIINIPGG